MPAKLRTKSWVLIFVVGTLWLGGAVFGLVGMLNYQTTPGTAAAPPSRWPAESHIQRAVGQATLVLTVHPHCPCTRSTIGELALLMTHCQGRVSAHVLFFKPPSMTDDWVKTDLWANASRIPGVTVTRDDNGEEAKRFHAATSGQTILYDADGKLVFSGGITGGRGHSGENAGRSAIVALLADGRSQRRETFVYGCSLLNPNLTSVTQSVCCKK